VNLRSAAAIGLFATAVGTSLAQGQERAAASPAARPVPETLTEQSFPAELVEAGRGRFSAQCGFCHGLDTGGGSGGPDLTRSELVARDVGGDLIAPVVRNGRPEAEVPMPAFPGLSNGDLAAMVAYIHDQRSRAESAEGGRRSVSVEDVQSGNARAGQRYFESNCSSCHSPDGDLEGIANRFEGLALMQRMLNPGGGRRSERATARVEVTTASGETIAGLLDYQDEFTIAVTMADGRYRSFSTGNIRYQIDDPLERHRQLLNEYTNEQLHDVLTYLHRLR
jgi:cytochrome c oxidase cbb3-type subunit 3